MLINTSDYCGYFRRFLAQIGLNRYIQQTKTIYEEKFTFLSDYF